MIPSPSDLIKHLQMFKQHSPANTIAKSTVNLLGDVFLPGSQEWEEAGRMKGNHLFDSTFGTVFHPENTGNENKVTLLDIMGSNTH